MKNIWNNIIYSLILLLVLASCSSQWSNVGEKPQKFPKLKEKVFLEKMDSLHSERPEYFYSKISPRDVLWLEGLQVLVDPMFFFNKIVDISDLHQEKTILRIVKKISEDKVDKIVIIGAGEAGRQVLRYLQLYNPELNLF